MWCFSPGYPAGLCGVKKVKKDPSQSQSVGDDETRGRREHLVKRGVALGQVGDNCGLRLLWRQFKVMVLQVVNGSVTQLGWYNCIME